MERFKENMREVMKTAWQFVRQNGYTMSKALKVAWMNLKLRLAMTRSIVQFKFMKMDGTVRVAFGTIKSELLPVTKGEDRRRNDTVQTYFDTACCEEGAWRCFKKAMLLEIVNS